MFSTRKYLLSVAAIAIMGCCQIAAHANPLVFSLNSARVTGTVGSAVHLFASANNTESLSEVITSLDDPTTLDFLSQTVANAPTLPQGILNVTIPSNAAVGTVFSSGFFVPGNGLTSLHSDNGNSTVTVTSVTVPNPEPATMLLLGTGLVSVVAILRRRRSSKN